MAFGVRYLLVHSRLEYHHDVICQCFFICCLEKNFILFCLIYENLFTGAPNQMSLLFNKKKETERLHIIGTLLVWK
jgi:hypothetical protein